MCREKTLSLQVVFINPYENEKDSIHNLDDIIRYDIIWTDIFGALERG